MFLLASSIALLGACGDPGGRPDGARVVAVAATAQGVPSPTARAAVARYEAAAGEARRHAGTTIGVERALGAAELARALSRTDDATVWRQRAREHLREASRRRALPGSCEATATWAEFELDDAGDLTAAYVVAHRGLRRFRAPGGSPECLARLERARGLAERGRPSDTELALLDADPDVDDPSAPPGAPAPRDLEDTLRDWAGERAGAVPATLRSIERLGGRGERLAGVRVVLEFDRVAVFERSELRPDGDLPRRFSLRLTRARRGAEIPESLAVGEAGLRRVRTRVEGEDLFVVFDVDADSVMTLHFFAEPYRLVLDFERAVGPVAALRPHGAPRVVRTVVLDPGHGGHDRGAVHRELAESRLALDIALRAADVLRRRLPGTRILLTRAREESASLDERVAFANAEGADLFVSIHLNSTVEEVARGGVTTFVLDREADVETQALAALENGTHTEEGRALAGLIPLPRGPALRAESRALAALVQRGALAGGRRVLPGLDDRGVRGAVFYVLVGARMPAALIEASFLSHPPERAALARDEYRAALADGIAEGIVRYARGETLAVR